MVVDVFKEDCIRINESRSWGQDGGQGLSMTSIKGDLQSVGHPLNLLRHIVRELRRHILGLCKGLEEELVLLGGNFEQIGHLSNHIDIFDADH